MIRGILLWCCFNGGGMCLGTFQRRLWWIMMWAQEHQLRSCPGGVLHSQQLLPPWVKLYSKPRGHGFCAGAHPQNCGCEVGYNSLSFG